MALATTVRELTADGAVAVIAVAGALDMASAPDLEAAILRAADAGKTLVAVDLTETTFMDSRGIYVLMRMGRHLRQSLGGLAVASRNPDIRRLIELSGLESVAPCFASREQALRGLLSQS